MNELLFEVVLFVVIVSVTLITSVLYPYLKKQIKDSKFADLVDEVERAVRRAEQRIVGEKQGRARYEQVIAYLKDWLLRHKIEITEEQLDTLIEAAVYSMQNE